MDYEPLRLLPEFRWAVPAAFLDALGACAFGRGDWLYSQAEAYQAWEPSSSRANVFAIQVLTPDRDETATPSAPTFTRNWSAPATVVLRSYPGETARTIPTTLGNIYRCLWTGNTTVLEASPWPKPPTLVTDFFRKDTPDWAPALRSAILQRGLNCTVCFGLPWDPTMPLYRTKRGKTERAWTALGGTWVDLPPTDILKDDQRRHAPTLRFSCFYLTKQISKSEVEDTLCRALATIPQPEDGGSAKGRVRIKSHGRIVWF